MEVEKTCLVNSSRKGKFAERPDCFEFAMEFLGFPENEVVRAYVERLEREIAFISTAATGGDAGKVEIQEARKEGASNERSRIAAWLDSDWSADAVEERYHRAWIAAKLRIGNCY